MTRQALMESASDLVLQWAQPGQKEKEIVQHGIANGHGAYHAFDACTVRDCGQQMRGARATCGYDKCKTSNTVRVNTFAHGDPNEVVERYITRKFEALGWKIGRTAKDNRCPKCFSAIKLAAKNKHHAKEKEASMNDKKVVPMKVAPQLLAQATEAPAIEPHRPMTRDDRRIIFNKIDEVYAGETVGYSAGWSDERIAKDLGVPRGWVGKIRDENFGPDIEEREVGVLAEAKAILADVTATGSEVTTLLADIKAFREKVEPIANRQSTLLDRCTTLLGTIRSIEERKKK